MGARHGRKTVPAELQEKREAFYNRLRELKVATSSGNSYKAEIRFLKGRLKFGDSRNSAPFPSMIIIFNQKIK